MLRLIAGALACPMCKDLVEAVKSRLAEGYFWSILLMLSMPFLLVGFITWRVVSATRRRGSS